MIALSICFSASAGSSQPSLSLTLSPDKSMHEHSLAHTLCNGILGMAASFLAVITSFQEQLEYSVRMTGALIGCVVGAITLYNLLNKKKK